MSAMPEEYWCAGGYIDEPPGAFRLVGVAATLGGMTVLVTGGAGYIGSHTVRLLVEQARDVVVLDNMELGHRAAVLGADLVVGDTRDGALVEQLVRDRGIDAAIHFAAYKAPGESMKDPGRYFENNVAG